MLHVRTLRSVLAWLYFLSPCLLLSLSDSSLHTCTVRPPSSSSTPIHLHRPTQTYFPHLSFLLLLFLPSLSPFSPLPSLLRYSRVPVYRGDVDNIVGVVYSKDLLEVRYSAVRYCVRNRAEENTQIHAQKHTVETHTPLTYACGFLSTQT